MSTIPGSRRRSLPATALAIVVSTLAGASPADAAVTCRYDEMFKFATIELGEHNDIAEVRVSGDEIQVEIPAQEDPLSCMGAGGPPTVNNTNRVLIDDNSDHPGTPALGDGNTMVQIWRAKQFAPGATPEGGGPAVSEIEFVVRSGEGSDQIRFRNDDGIADGDAFTIGTDGINWNTNAAEAKPDADLTYSGVDTLSFVGGPGNDVVTAQGENGTGDAFAGPAHLRLNGGGGDDVFTGGLGDDELGGGEGDDTLLGGSGDDQLGGEGGDDTIAGGQGTHDRASFSNAAGATVDLNLTGPQDTGAGNDVLTEVEDLHGSQGPDALTGDAGANDLVGDEGDDMLDGGAGDDVLNGGEGSDTVTYAHAGTGVAANLASGAFGGGGSDTLPEVENLVGSPFADDLTGGDGPNHITGLGGVDRISALGGPDTLNVRDGESDKVGCGSQDDSVLADRRSVDASIDGDCETVDFVPEPPIADPPPGGAASPDTTISTVLRGARSQRVLKRNGVVVKVSCPLEDCTARVSGSSGKMRLTPLTRSIPGGAARTLKLRLAGRQRRALRSALAAGRRPKLRVTVRVTDAAGNAARRSLTVRVKP